eukprot:9595076-Heterocapsa_arctica.AAC.1
MAWQADARRSSDRAGLVPAPAAPRAASRPGSASACSRESAGRQPGAAQQCRQHGQASAQRAHFRRRPRH